MSKNEPSGRGALFKNDKQGNEKRPDYTGTATIFDKEFNISAWIQTSKNGIKYLGLSFNERQKAPENDAGGQPGVNSASNSEGIDDNIPF